ncbi:MAG: hypothetical protein DWI31_02025 [Candidatus Aquidulcis sp.]|nr:MAG: hypothetical protein DWI31_02025 [Candidatus Aquidulcis sp.]
MSDDEYEKRFRQLDDKSRAVELYNSLLNMKTEEQFRSFVIRYISLLTQNVYYEVGMKVLSDRKIVKNIGAARQVAKNSLKFAQENGFENFSEMFLRKEGEVH